VEDEEEKEKEQLADDEEINLMMAVGEEEFELYQQMDLDRQTADEEEAKRMGWAKVRPRLMTEEEVPAWVKLGQAKISEMQVSGQGHTLWMTSGDAPVLQSAHFHLSHRRPKTRRHLTSRLGRGCARRSRTQRH
jgi:hypothetical protein